jgi:hypothetical protein
MSAERPVVTLLEGPRDRPRRWRIDYPDGSVIVRRTPNPLRVAVCAVGFDESSPGSWVERPIDGIPCPDPFYDTSD